MIQKLLIANRGEIACRVIKTAKRLGVKTVAIYSDIDRHAKHVEIADQAFHVGPNPSAQSYLNGNKILEIAQHSNCEALHPGFGFLSENAEFADLCEKNKLIFIGPPSSAIRMMGSKSESKKIMINANVPVVPGYHGENQEKEFLLQEARKIGYPIMIKAVLGGGGKGMRIVRREEDFYENLESSKRESLKSFKDDRVLIEKYIEKPRHIEIQVFGDKLSNYVYLFERDCSIQRRHQKVIEEAPSNINSELRSKIGESAIEAARAVGYYNAGTVEFIFDTMSKQYYFMEMNTRLQVEHPITEMITGVDLVEWQLKVASGYRLPKSQNELVMNGHAMEARIYSEDPFQNFLPANGKLKYLREPLNNEKVRIDSGIREKDEISIFYDPMISKLIVWGKDRNTAIREMSNALNEYRVKKINHNYIIFKVVGLPTNIKFLKNVTKNEVFLNGEFDTGFIGLNEKSLIAKKKEFSSKELLSIVLGQILKEKESMKQIGLPTSFLNLRTNYELIKKFNFKINGQHLENITKFEGVITYLKNGNFHIAINDFKRNFVFDEIQFCFDDQKGVAQINTQSEIFYNNYFFENAAFYTFDEDHEALQITCEEEILPEHTLENFLTSKIVKSPMPGTLIKINAKEGEILKKGDVLCILEAMKMEHVIKATEEIKITKIYPKEGSFTEAGANLIEFEKIPKKKAA